MPDKKKARKNAKFIRIRTGARLEEFETPDTQVSNLTIQLKTRCPECSEMIYVDSTGTLKTRIVSEPNNYRYIWGLFIQKTLEACPHCEQTVEVSWNITYIVGDPLPIKPIVPILEFEQE